ncbi:SIS domain-containing protein [Granulicella tundricola]|uniref:Glutamine--fructose-6-phosphate aminotransferase [isomerizing] n=1 Tax=Granulicella tundricola (strain ATCC BAA-1859 / DSM 23138 / MP5ACTX9) TaxID=1198114 RepID=E8X2K0_GRATM|nr:SIS domain-containing protein [Granulicella tundricola]ADW69224.1 Glutamine--fructose-6-phosphate transaminase (isomerizing) [Granulicella tundricola MP5ACTX9]
MSQQDSPTPYPHWMLREIHEQPDSLTATLDRYVGPDGFREEVCQPIRTWLVAANKEIVIAASGSSRHAGMIAEILIEDICGTPVDVEYASEYCYRPERATKNAALLVISQSGETADTLAALRKANEAGHPTLAITNVINSTMAREASASFCTLAGRERAIPATKSFTAQLLNLQLLSLLAAESQQAIDAAELKTRLAQLASLPDTIKVQLEGWETAARAAADHFKEAESFLYLGRGVHYPVAREGALKLKESAYLHAEGYPSGELKHGPNALVSERIPLVMIATVDRSDADSVQRYDKVVQLMRDMRTQGANILAIANVGDQEVAAVATQVISVAEAPEPLLAICEVIPLQMLSYFMAINRGIDVDHPRNLTKAVLAE